jgi:hypothetical protein
MPRQPADVELLVECATSVAKSIGAPPPSRSAVLTVISKVVDEREALDTAHLGLITRDEAVKLVLAHFQSSLFDFSGQRTGADPWSDPRVVDAVKRGLFGTES